MRGWRGGGGTFLLASSRSAARASHAFSCWYWVVSHRVSGGKTRGLGGTVFALSSGVLGREACHELAGNTIGELVTTKANCNGRTMVEYDNP